jgi:hypothetical protein
MKYLFVTTSRPDFRSPIDGWSHEDITESRKDLENWMERNQRNFFQCPVGMMGGGRGKCYPTILHALVDGYELYSGPTLTEYNDYKWILTMSLDDYRY